MERKPKILLLEDDPDMRSLLERILSYQDYDVTSVETGYQAIEAAKKTAFDLIVADVRVDGPDGIEVLSEAKKDRPDVGTLAVSGYSSLEDDARAERIGIGGGSYGGFMTCWALGHDTEGRYRAGLVERAVTDFESMAGTSDIGQDFIRRMLDATIEEDVEAIRRQSPLNWAHQIKVPTLILHSEEDWRCPIEQAERLYAAIWRNSGNAILVRFSGENHELSRSGSPKHRVERFEIVHEFFAGHLGGADFGTSHLNQA